MGSENSVDSITNLGFNPIHFFPPNFIQQLQKCSVKEFFFEK